MIGQLCCLWASGGGQHISASTQGRAKPLPWWPGSPIEQKRMPGHHSPLKATPNDFNTLLGPTLKVSTSQQHQLTPGT